MRRGAAIDLVLDRGRENRSQLVFTTARAKPCRGNPREPAASPAERRHPGLPGAGGVAKLRILVDIRDPECYRLAGRQARTVGRALLSGDYVVTV